MSSERRPSERQSITDTYEVPEWWSPFDTVVVIPAVRARGSRSGSRSGSRPLIEVAVETAWGDDAPHTVATRRDRNFAQNRTVCARRLWPGIDRPVIKVTQSVTDIRAVRVGVFSGGEPVPAIRWCHADDD